MTGSGDIRDGLAAPARAALAVVEQLGVPFGLERSTKFAAGRLNQDRFLASMHRDDLGADAVEVARHLAEALGMPDEARRSVPELLDRAQLLHVGYEGGAAPIRKLYFEDASAVEGAIGPVLVHTALKWAAKASPSVRTELYRWRPERQDAAVVRNWLDAEGGPAATFARQLLLGVDDAAPVFLLDVVAPGGVRRSFDVNLYRLGLSLGDIAEQIASMVVHYGVEARAVEDWLEPWRQSSLGHVSGGVGSDGLAFGTLYYGIEARRGSGRG